VKAVVDTNVIVSAVISLNSPPDRVLRAWQNGAFDLVLSDVLLDELADVLHRGPIRRRIGWPDEAIQRFLHSFEQVIIHAPRMSVRVVRDASDDRVVEAGLAANADYIVTGDRDLLDLGSYEGIEIVTPARFLAILREQQTGV
jgi:putative PIN family toxin of toxin-antitoxin system